jgi:hypothetical protein
MLMRILPIAALVLATAASAQTPPPQDGQQATAPGTHQPPGPPPGPMGPGGPGGPGGWHHMPPPPPPSKAAHFRLRNGNAGIDVKCADDEPMKACVDAAGQLIDKLSGIPERAGR